MEEKTKALKGLFISPKLNFTVPEEKKKQNINAVAVKKLLCVLFFHPNVGGH